MEQHQPEELSSSEPPTPMTTGEHQHHSMSRGLIHSETTDGVSVSTAYSPTQQSARAWMWSGGKAAGSLGGGKRAMSEQSGRDGQHLHGHLWNPSGFQNRPNFKRTSSPLVRIFHLLLIIYVDQGAYGSKERFWELSYINY